MGARISLETRALIAELRSEGLPWREVGARAGMSPNGARRAHGRIYSGKIGRPRTAKECAREGCENKAHAGRKICQWCQKTALRRGISPENLPPKKVKKSVDMAPGGV